MTNILTGLPGVEDCCFKLIVIFVIAGQQTTMAFPTSGIHRKVKASSSNAPLLISLLLNILLIAAVVFTFSGCSSRTISADLTFHGGHPAGTKRGTCYCSNNDSYCMCTPSLAIDVVIFSGKDHVWTVRRKDTNQLTVMGGFVNVGETVSSAVARELMEEMGIALEEPPMLFGVYSDPRRDNRRHTASAAFAIFLDGSEHPKAADDIKSVVRMHISEIDAKDFFADHKTIIKDCLNLLDGKKLSTDFVESEETFAPDLQRSICHARSGT